MQKMQVVMWIALAVAVVIPLYFWLRSREILGGFRDLMAERHFVPEEAPLPMVFASPDAPMGFFTEAAFAGSLGAGMPISLLLFRRTEAVPHASTLSVGVYLPPGLPLALPPGLLPGRPSDGKLDEGWRKLWADRAARGRDDVVYAAVGAGGGFVIIWKGAPLRKNVATHLDALVRSLPTSNP